MCITLAATSLDSTVVRGDSAEGHYGSHLGSFLGKHGHRWPQLYNCTKLLSPALTSIEAQIFFVHIKADGGEAFQDVVSLGTALLSDFQL
jgi:hypothetical protein